MPLRVLVHLLYHQGFSDYTKIAHAMCDRCIIPIKVRDDVDGSSSTDLLAVPLRRQT